MVQPYLYLNGNCSEAIDFYEKVFNGENKKIMRYKDAPANPNFPVPDKMRELVLHAEMNINGTQFNFSDSMEKIIPGNMISLALSFGITDEVVSTFNKLKEDGEVLMELAPQFFSPMYGWVKDKFGVGWQLICQK